MRAIVCRKCDLCRHAAQAWGSDGEQRGRGGRQDQCALSSSPSPLAADRLTTSWPLGENTGYSVTQIANCNTILIFWMPYFSSTMWLFTNLRYVFVISKKCSVRIFIFQLGLLVDFKDPLHTIKTSPFPPRALCLREGETQTGKREEVHGWGWEGRDRGRVRPHHLCALITPRTLNVFTNGFRYDYQHN